MLKGYIEQLNNKGEVYLKIVAKPGFNKTIVKEASEDEVRIDIGAKPEQGKANAELCRFLAKEFKVDKNNVKIIGGKSNRVKLIKIIK